MKIYQIDLTAGWTLQKKRTVNLKTQQTESNMKHGEKMARKIMKES